MISVEQQMDTLRQRIDCAIEYLMVARQKYMFAPDHRDTEKSMACCAEMAWQHVSAALKEMEKPAYRYPGNDDQLYEEAGKTADTYKGGGWMAIRQMLVDFHKRMKKMGV